MATTPPSVFGLRLSPHGRLAYEPLQGEALSGPRQAADGPPTDSGPALDVAARIALAFAVAPAAGLLHLAGVADGVELPAELAFFRGWARRFVEAISQLDEDGRAAFMRAVPGPGLEAIVRPPDELALATTIACAPPFRGLEYLDASVLRDTWFEMVAVVRGRAGKAAGGLAEVLAAVEPRLHLLGRVTFHLAENRRDEQRPFAFLATYAHRPAAKAAVQHLPLAKAIEESADRRDQAKLAELLTPVRAAADRSELVREWLESRAIFTPRAITIAEAHRFLRDVPAMEESGLAVRVPDWWRSRKPPRPAVQVRLGSSEPSAIGVDGLLDFQVGLALDGEPLNAAEARDLLAGTEGLTLLRGRWVEVDRDRLQQALSHWKQLQRDHAEGIDFVKGMRLLAGADLDFGGNDAAAERTAEWSEIAAGDWLRDTMSQLRDPAGRPGCEPGRGLAATLRPYQEDGVRWLWFLTRLRLGACLADDMGLGKTIQLIDLFLRLRADDAGQPAGQTVSKAGAAKAAKARRPSLLVVPASLLGNWRQELARFAPQLKAIFVHRSESAADLLDRIAREPERELAGCDLVVTTYALVKKLPWLTDVSWRLAEICGPIAERQEKVLVFTQFQSLCDPLAWWLEEVFGRPGVVLLGGVPVGKRKDLVRRFQNEDERGDAPPFFVVSVKAGGTGLNLTAASHVVHFDRWWNPAVENQATDRAFRIGQKRNVLVHKFVCRGTMEERIDEMIRAKQDLAEQVLGPTAAGETLLTEMSDEQLLNLVSLDLGRAAVE